MPDLFSCAGGLFRGCYSCCCCCFCSWSHYWRRIASHTSFFFSFFFFIRFYCDISRGSLYWTRIYCLALGLAFTLYMINFYTKYICFDILARKPCTVHWKCVIKIEFSIRSLRTFVVLLQPPHAFVMVYYRLLPAACLPVGCLPLSTKIFNGFYFMCAGIFRKKAPSSPCRAFIAFRFLLCIVRLCVCRGVYRMNEAVVGAHKLQAVGPMNVKSFIHAHTKMIHSYTLRVGKRQAIEKRRNKNEERMSFLWFLHFTVLWRRTSRRHSVCMMEVILLVLFIWWNSPDAPESMSKYTRAA